MRYNVKMSYYCTVTEDVIVEACSEEAKNLVEQGIFEQYKESRSDVVIDWDSITFEEIKIIGD